MISACTYLETVGNTPLISLPWSIKNVKLFAKLESRNPTGSIKDRAACFVLKKILTSKEIDQDTVIVESSSGNFGLSLSAYCKKSQLKFICVIDEKISRINETLISQNGAHIVKITEHDENGGYVINRIKKVNQIISEIKNSYFVNQYQNKYVAEAYGLLGNEIASEIPTLDYVFVAVSSGGTVTGVSRKLKEHFPAIKIIAVDIEGSVIFQNKPKRRNIPGIGSSLVPQILKDSFIDDIIIVDEDSVIRSCYGLLDNYQLFMGGSSGLVYEAALRYFTNRTCPKNTKALVIFPDGGDRYIDTIYNLKWCEKIQQSHLLER